MRRLAVKTPGLDTPSSTSAAATSRRPSSAAGCTPAAGCCSWTNPPEVWTSRPSSRSTG
ncbi:hypothetical protein NKH18_01650 [Streptomyces sp. M10(2022)]